MGSILKTFLKKKSLYSISFTKNKMPFVIFENKEEYKKFKKILYNPSEKCFNENCILGLEGKIEGEENSVYILSKKDLKKLNKEGIQYKDLNEKEAINYINKEGKEFFKGLKKLYPKFIA